MSFEILEMVSESLMKYIDANDRAALHICSNLHLLFIREVPTSIRDRILESLIKHIDTNEQAAEEMSSHLGYVFRASISTRDRILESLIKHIDTNEQAAHGIAFEGRTLLELPGSMSNRILEGLIKYADSDEYAASTLMFALYQSFEKFRPEFKNRVLLTLSETKFHDVRRLIGSFVAAYCNVIDATILNDLLKKKNIIDFFQQNNISIDDYLKS